MVILRGHFMTSAWSLGLVVIQSWELMTDGCIQKSIDKAGYFFPQNHDPRMAIRNSGANCRHRSIDASLRSKTQSIFSSGRKGTLDIEIYWDVEDRSTQRHAILHSWLVTCCSFFSENIWGWNIFSDKAAARGRWGKKWQVELAIMITFISLLVIGISTYMNGWFLDDVVQ